MSWIENALTWVGRVLLGLYFIVPGISKFADFDGMATYMTNHGMVAVPFLLVVTAVLQISGGIALIAGFFLRSTSFVLGGLVLVISVVLHDFWNMPEGIDRGHEMQNFIKNMAIMAGLLVLAGNPNMTHRRLFGKNSEVQPVQ